MPRAASQFNIRSAFARARAHELSQKTGLTVAQIVEDALRAYIPPGLPAEIGGLIRRGPILVLPAAGPVITQAQADAALDAAREPEA
jgi:hypothetical protein